RACLFHARAIASEYSAGQPVDCIVDDSQALREVADFDRGEHGTENFFLSQARARIYIPEHRRLDEVSLGVEPLAARQQLTFALAVLEVAAHLGILRAVA